MWSDFYKVKQMDELSKENEIKAQSDNSLDVFLTSSKVFLKWVD